MEINLTDEKAEAELLELIRLKDVQNFTLTISVRDGTWTVTAKDHDHAGSTIGNGESFAKAWFRQAPGWVRTDVDHLSE